MNRERNGKYYWPVTKEMQITELVVRDTSELYTLKLLQEKFPGVFDDCVVRAKEGVYVKTEAIDRLLVQVNTDKDHAPTGMTGARLRFLKEWRTRQEELGYTPVRRTLADVSLLETPYRYSYKTYILTPQEISSFIEFVTSLGDSREYKLLIPDSCTKVNEELKS